LIRVMYNVHLFEMQLTIMNLEKWTIK